MKNILFIFFPLFTLTITSCGDDDSAINPIETSLEQGLVAHIPFDSNVTNLASGASGTLNGGIEFTADRNGNVSSAILGKPKFHSFTSGTTRSNCLVIGFMKICTLSCHKLSMLGTR